MSVDEMHTRAHVEFLEQRRENHMLTLMFNRTREEQYRDDSPRTTRSADAVSLKIPRAKTNKLTKAPIVLGSKLWNEMPVAVRNAKSKLELKKLVRKHRASLPIDLIEDPES